MEIRLLVIRTADMQRLADFYALLGFVLEYHKHGNSPFHFSAEVGGAVLEIYPLAKDQTEADKHLRVGFELDDFETVMQNLRSAQVKFLMEPAETQFGYMAILEDTDGRKVEVYKKRLKEWHSLS